MLTCVGFILALHGPIEEHAIHSHVVHGNSGQQVPSQAGQHAGGSAAFVIAELQREKHPLSGFSQRTDENVQLRLFGFLVQCGGDAVVIPSEGEIFEILAHIARVYVQRFWHANGIWAAHADARCCCC